ncbi:DinB family protein [Halobacillus sp. B23F22_1]|uniref:DinB family protein n=1 Tax=Halobacillus sp. B23F22_1 TaxID=3459514 RepID=UPI00373E9E07
MIHYQIEPLEGYSPKVGELVFMLEHTREVTLEEVAGLTVEELDALPHDRGNSIAALLYHIAAIEFVHQVISFENRDLTLREKSKWGTALELGETARSRINHKNLHYYIALLQEVRSETLKQLKVKDDKWLSELKHWTNGIPHNNYYLWYHVMEDEINHRGQIRMVKSLQIDKKL